MDKHRLFKQHQCKGEVVELLLKCGLYNRGTIKHLAGIFNCSESSIIAAKNRVGVNTDVTVHTSRKLRESIRLRDGEACCYCGDCSTGNTYIVEHVVPASRGGHAREYNLVMSCQSCNVEKGNAVWIPSNFNTLMELNPDWGNKILNMAGRRHG